MLSSLKYHRYVILVTPAIRICCNCSGIR